MNESVTESDGGGADLKKTRRRKAAYVDTHRLPPNDPGAEQGVIGCILLSPNDCLAQVIIKLTHGKEEFYDLRHKTIFETMLEMLEDREAIDVITIQARMKTMGRLDEVGGIPYLNALQDAVPSAANVTYYADIVHEKFLVRRAIEICSDTVGGLYDAQHDIEQIMDEAERRILSLRESKVVEQRPTRIVMHDVVRKIEEFNARSGQIMGLSTGFPDLDKLTDGLHPGDMIVVAARPSMGKTSLAMNIVEHVCLVQKLPVGVFSLEMTAESLLLRSLCSLARVNLRNIKDGFMTERDYPKITSAAGKLSNSQLHIDESSSLSVMQFKARARRMQQEFGIKLFVVDYLQLLHSTSARAGDNRQQEISEISGGIKAIAKELKVPVIVLSQLNRELEKEKNRKPRLSDLRESGAIEQDADLVGLLYKPGVTNAEQDEEPSEETDGIAVNLLIAKQRNGPTGDISLTFLKPYTRFESAAKVSDDDVQQGDLPV